MDPWRLATQAQRRINFLAGTALASCVFAWLAGFGSTSVGKPSRFHRERPCEVNPGTPRTNSHREHRAYGHAASDRSGERRRADIELATAAPSAPEKATDRTAGLDQPKSFAVASLPDSSQTRRPRAIRQRRYGEHAPSGAGESRRHDGKPG